MEKHAGEGNATLTSAEYEAILDALLGAHGTAVPGHLQPEGHDAMRDLLLQARIIIQNSKESVPCPRAQPLGFPRSCPLDSACMPARMRVLRKGVQVPAGRHSFALHCPL
jgi:hypothetical protein